MKIRQELISLVTVRELLYNSLGKSSRSLILLQYTLSCVWSLK